jgi:hypothetical protein
MKKSIYASPHISFKGVLGVFINETRANTYKHRHHVSMFCNHFSPYLFTCTILHDFTLFTLYVI